MKVLYSTFVTTLGQHKGIALAQGCFWIAPTTSHLQPAINSFTKDLIKCLTSLMYIQLAADCHEDHQHFCLPKFSYLLKEEKKTVRSALKGRVVRYKSYTP